MPWISSRCAYAGMLTASIANAVKATTAIFLKFTVIVHFPFRMFRLRRHRTAVLSNHRELGSASGGREQAPCVSGERGICLGSHRVQGMHVIHDFGDSCGMRGREHCQRGQSTDGDFSKVYDHVHFPLVAFCSSAFATFRALSTPSMATMASAAFAGEPVSAPISALRRSRQRRWRSAFVNGFVLVIRIAGNQAPKDENSPEMGLKLPGLRWDLPRKPRFGRRK